MNEIERQIIEEIRRLKTALAISDRREVSAGLFAPLVHTHAFADLTSKPTTLAGYGITDVLKAGAGVLTLSAAGAYTLTVPATGTAALGAGTTNYIAKWTGTNSIGNSLIQDDGATIAIGATPSATALVQITSAPTVTSGTFNGINLTYTATPASASSAIYQGLAFNVQTSTGNANAFSQSVRAIAGNAYHRGTATLSTLTAIHVQVGVLNTGSVSNARGIRLTNIETSTGKPDALYGIDINTDIATNAVNYGISISATSAAGNLKYGLAIGAISGGTGANVAIETLGGQLQFTHNANSTLATFTGASTFTASTPLILLTRNDANTAAIATVQTLRTNSTGTTGVGFGGRLLWQLESVTIASQDAGAIDVSWGRNSTPDGVHTFAGRTSTLDLKTVDNAGALTTRLSIYGSLVRIGDASNYTQFAADGTVLLVGTAKYERHIQLAAKSDGLVANQPTPVDFFTVGGLQFSTTGAKYAYCQFEMPDDWDGTDVYFEIDWFPDSGAMSGTDTIEWTVEYRAIAEGELINNGTSVTLTSTDSADYSQYKTKHARVTLAYNNANQPLTKQDHVFVKISRNTGVANDFGGSVTVSGYEVIYTSNGFPTSN